MVPLSDVRAAAEALAEPGAVGVLLAVVLPDHLVPFVVVPALEVVAVVVALVVLVTLRLGLPLDLIPALVGVDQVDRRWRLLAWAVEAEPLAEQVAVVPPVAVLVPRDLVEGGVDVGVAGEVVRLEGEGERLHVRARVEQLGELVPVAAHHALADLGLDDDGVALARLEVLDIEGHRVVARIDVRVLVPALAPPGAVGVFLAVVLVVPVVGLAVAVAVPVVVPAPVLLNARTAGVILALVVLVVVDDLFVLDAVVVQGEWGGGLLARAPEVEPVPGNLVVPPAAAAVRLVLIERDVDVHAAREVVRLDVPRRGVGVRGCGEVLIALFVLPSSLLGVDVDMYTH